MEEAYELQIACLKNLQIGAKRRKVRVVQELPRRTSANPFYLYQVLIDFAGAHRKWQMFLDPDHPEFHPDFVFDVPFLPDVTSSEACAKWSLNASYALVNLIKEFHEQYILYRHKQLEEYPQLNNQFMNLLSETNYGRCCEVDVINNGPGTFNDTVKFVVPIEVDLTNLPPYLKEEHPGGNTCSVSLSFETPNQTQVKASLEISRAVESALGGIANLRIPDYGSSSLTQYITKIEKLLNSTIDLVHKRYEKRKSIMIRLLTTFNGSVIEYDSETFFEAALLSSLNGVYFILYVTLSEQYPMEEPIVYIQSVYFIGNSLFKKCITGYQYDPFWSDEEKIEKIKLHLQEHSLKIQSECLKYR